MGSVDGSAAGSAAGSVADGFLLALDFGTSGMKASLFETRGGLVSTVVENYPVVSPNPGWNETDPAEWWAAAVRGMRTLLDRAKAPPGRILAVGTCALMEAGLPVDRDGNALRPSILWTDNRAASLVEWIAAELSDPMAIALGMSRILWIKQNEPDVYRRTYKFIQCKDYIAARLCGRIGIDPTDSWGMGLFDVARGAWRTKEIEAVGVALDKIPEVHPSLESVGGVTAEAAAQTGLMQGTPVVAVGGDAFCAPVGAGVHRRGQVFMNLGTSAQIITLIDAADMRPVSEMVGFAPHLDPRMVCVGGRAMAAGHSYAWALRTLGQREAALARWSGRDTGGGAVSVHGAAAGSADPFELLDMEVAAAPRTSPPLVCLPQLLGRNENNVLGGLVLGLRLNHTRVDLVRCVLEGVAYELRQNLEMIRRVTGGEVSEVRLIGGGAKGVLWSQIICDVVGREIVVPKAIRTATSLGAALASGVAIGLYSGLDETASVVRIVRTHRPSEQEHARYDRIYSVYRKVYEMIGEAATELGRCDLGRRRAAGGRPPIERPAQSDETVVQRGTHR